MTCCDSPGLLIYVNDPPQQVSPDLFLSADGVKLWREVCNKENKLALQKDLTRLRISADNIGLTISTSKCKTAHSRYKSRKSSLEVFQVEKIKEYWYPLV